MSGFDEYARIALAYMPDQMPQRIKDALEADGYTVQQLIEWPRRDNIRAAPGVHPAKVRWIAANIAKLPQLLRKP